MGKRRKVGRKIYHLLRCEEKDFSGNKKTREEKKRITSEKRERLKGEKVK